MTSELRNKAVKGVTWNLLERFGIQGMRFVMGIILARLLMPKDYGLIGMIMAFFAVARVFVDSGFNSAYIQKKEVSDADADTVFYFNLLISILLYVVLWLAAPLISNFYEEPKLVLLTRVMAIVLIINSFNIIQVAQLTRAVNFKRKTIATLVATLLAGICGIMAAYFGLGVWALVIQILLARAIVTVGLWISSNWKPGFQFSYSALKEMFRFGSWVLLANIIKQIFRNIYIFFIGRLFPANQLGLFTKANNLHKQLSQRIGQSLGIVSFPVLSRVQDDKPRFTKAIRSILRHSMLLMTPLLVVFIVIARPFVILLLTAKWTEMIPYLQLFCIIGMFYPASLANSQALKALGKSDLSFWLNFLKGGLRIVNILITYRWGVIYIIAGELVVTLLFYAASTYYTHKLVGYGLLKQLADIKEILMGACVAGVTGYCLGYLYISNLWLNLIFCSTITVVLYIGTQYLFNKSLVMETLNLKKQFKN